MRLALHVLSVVGFTFVGYAQGVSERNSVSLNWRNTGPAMASQEGGPKKQLKPMVQRAAPATNSIEWLGVEECWHCFGKLN